MSSGLFIIDSVQISMEIISIRHSIFTKIDDLWNYKGSMDVIFCVIHLYLLKLIIIYIH